MRDNSIHTAKIVYLTAWLDNIHTARYSRPIMVNPNYVDSEKRALEEAAQTCMQCVPNAIRVTASFNKPDDWGMLNS